MIGDGFRRDECRRSETEVSWSKDGGTGGSGTTLGLFDAEDQYLGILTSGPSNDIPIGNSNERSNGDGFGT